MEKCFDELIEKVLRVRELEEEREKMKSDREELLKRTSDAFSVIFEKYRNEEQQLDMMIKDAESENRENKAEIVRLTKESIKASAEGAEFIDIDKLNKLKADVATHPQKVEALEQLKCGVCVPSKDVDMLEEYHRQGRTIGNSILRIGNEIQEILVDVRDRISLNCFASFEHIPGREEFAPEIFTKLRNMRKEETEE